MKHQTIRPDETPIIKNLTPEAFWALPIADRDWLSFACGVSDATARRMIEVTNAATVRIGARTFIFPRRIAAQIERLAERIDVSASKNDDGL